MHFLADYSLFLLKIITLVIALLVSLAGIISLSSKGKDKNKTTGTLSITKLNKQYDNVENKMIEATGDKASLKQHHKDLKKSKKINKEKTQPKLFVVDFTGDFKASATRSLTQEVSAIILGASKDDQVLIRLESPGGVVNGYGLAAAQIDRLRQANITVTIAVDKVAASGGYMMASVAHKIIAAPFAMIGSIGVITQLPNFHRFLKNKDIDFEQVTAGKYKRTLTMLGQNTDEDREKTQEEINEIHELFKAHITQYRPSLDIDTIATGECWFGTQAISLGLIDTLQTSEDHLLQQRDTFDIFLVKHVVKQPFISALCGKTESMLYKWIKEKTPSENNLH